jgi:hypothetical protein
MEQIKDNERMLRNTIQRQDFFDVSVIDIFTAFYVLSSRRIDSPSIMNDRHFTFLLGIINNIPPGETRRYWFDHMFRIYERISKIDPDDSNWLLLQANLIYLAPVGSPLQ